MLVGLDAVDRDHLVAEEAGVGRRDRPLVRPQGPEILVLARDLEVAGHERGLLDHVAPVEGERQPVVDDQVDQLPAAEAVAEAGPRQRVGRVRHRLHPSGHDDLVVARPDHLVGDRHRPDPGGADLVDGVGGHVHGDAGGHGGLAGRRLPDAGLQHLAHDHVLHVSRLDARALERGAD